MTWLIDTLVTTGALIVLVLLLRRPVSRHFGPGMAYALWALPLLRLFLPPLVLPAAPVPTVPSEVVYVTETTAATSTATAAPAWSFAWVEPVMIGLWLAGAAGFLVWRLLGYRALRAELLAEARPVGQVEDIRLIETPAAPTPLAFGLSDKVIALPPGFMAQADRAARDLAIAHELEHHRGRDLAVNMAMQPLLALHWFNPLAWLAWRALRRDQEAACDARVVAGRDHAIRAAYGALIADYARAPRVSLAASIACPVVGEASVVHRLRSLTMTDPTPTRRTIGRLLLAGAALALPLTASVTYAAAQDAVDPPAPPAPPAAPAAPAAPEAPEAPATPHIMIIDHHDGADPRDSKLATRVIEKDGKTIVLKTAKPLSDAEIEQRIAKAEASMKDAEAMVWSSTEKGADGKRKVITMIRAGDGKDGKVEVREGRRVMVLSGDSVDIAGDGPASSIATFRNKDGKPTSFAMVTSGDVKACADGSEGRNIEQQATKDGQHQIVKMRFCHKGGTPAMALEAMKKARDRMKDNSELSAEIKDKILKNLDAEIERLSKQG